MLYLDPVGRHVTDPLELSRAAATRHSHVSALSQQRHKATSCPHPWIPAVGGCVAPQPFPP